MVEVPSSNLGSPTKLKLFKTKHLQRFEAVKKTSKNNKIPSGAQIVPR